MLVLHAILMRSVCCQHNCRYHHKYFLLHTTWSPCMCQMSAIAYATAAAPDANCKCCDTTLQCWQFSAQITSCCRICQSSVNVAGITSVPKRASCMLTSCEIHRKMSDKSVRLLHPLPGQPAPVLRASCSVSNFNFLSSLFNFAIFQTPFLY